MRKGIMALEGLEEVSTGSDVDFADAPENDMLDMNESAGELEKLDADIDEAASTAETLDTMADSLKTSAENGGMGEDEARAIEVAVEHMLSRVGFPKSRARVMPSMEAFGSKSSKVRATMEAFETVKKYGKQLWDGIIKALETAKNWIVNFFNSMLDGCIKYSGRAAAMIKAAEAKKGSAPKEGAGKIDATSIAKVLNIKGIMPNGSNFAKEYKSFAANSGGKSVTNDVANAEKLSKIVNELIVDIANDENFNLAKKNLTTAMVGMAPGTEKVSKDIDKAGGERLFEAARLFGQVSIFTLINPEQGEIKTYVGPTTGASTSPDKADAMDALTPEEVIEIATAAKTQMDSYAALKGALKSIEKVQDETVAACKKASAADKGDTKDTSKKNAAVAATAARCIVSLTTNAMAAKRSTDINITKAALDYCGMSLKTLGAAPAAAAAK